MVGAFQVIALVSAFFRNTTVFGAVPDSHSGGLSKLLSPSSSSVGASVDPTLPNFLEMHGTDEKGRANRASAPSAHARSPSHQGPSLVSDIHAYPTDGEAITKGADAEEKEGLPQKEVPASEVSQKDPVPACDDDEERKRVSSDQSFWRKSGLAGLATAGFTCLCALAAAPTQCPISSGPSSMPQMLVISGVGGNLSGNFLGSGTGFWRGDFSKAF